MTKLTNLLLKTKVLSICVIVLSYLLFMETVNADFINYYGEYIEQSDEEEAFSEKLVEDRNRVGMTVFFVILIGAPTACFVIEFIKDFIIK